MEPPETIVLVSVDDLRYDCVEASGSSAWLEKYDAAEGLSTPTLNEVVESGMAYERATSTSSYTPPSHASLFTGAYPSEHGVKTFFNKLDGQRTLASALSEQGYETIAWIENIALEMLDVTAGFDRVVCPFEEDGANLFEFLDEANDVERVFAFIHLFDVHKPYGYATGGTERATYNEDYPECIDPVLPEGILASKLVDEAREEAAEVVPNYDELSPPLREFADYRSLDYLLRTRLEAETGHDRFRYLVRMYVEGVNRFDSRRLADLVGSLKGLMSNESMFVLTSDHGETKCRWGDREDLMNSFNVSEGAVRVPLVVQGSLESDLVSSHTPVSHVDVYPTVIDAIGAECNDTSGRSLLGDLEPDRPLFNESWYYSGGTDFFGNLSETGDGGLSEVAVRIGDCKLIHSFAETGSPPMAVKRLDAPIPEETNGKEACSPIDSLEDELEDFLQGVSRTCSPDIGPKRDAMEDRLKALGYLE